MEGVRGRRVRERKVEGNCRGRVGQHRASGRKWKSEMGGVVLISAEEGQPRIRIDLPGQRWCDVHAMAGDIVYEGIRRAVEQIDTRVECVRSVQRSPCVNG